MIISLEKPQIIAKSIIEELKQIKELADSDKSIHPITHQELIYQIEVAIIHLTYEEPNRERLLTYLTIARNIAWEKRTATAKAAVVPKIDALIQTLDG